jgi:UDP-N-acetylglucosamine 3-dehydrogenase
MISYAHMHAYTYSEMLAKHPEARLTAIWDADEERGTAAAAQYGASYYSSLGDFLNEPLDAVIVCSENANHMEHVIAAAKAGKPVLCEKPIATNAVDAERMIKACCEANVFLHVAFPVRYSTAVIRAREHIRSGSMGRILAIRSTNRGKRPGGWFLDPALAGGGAAADHVVHLTDIFRWLTGDEVKRVYAELDTRFTVGTEVEDCGLVLLELESGIIASIDPSWSIPLAYPAWGDLTMEIVGTKGTLSLDLYRQSSRWYAGDSQETQLLPWLDNLDEGLIGDFIVRVQNKLSPAIPGEDGLKTLQVVHACYASHQSGKFVDLDFLITRE